MIAQIHRKDDYALYDYKYQNFDYKIFFLCRPYFCRGLAKPSHAQGRINYGLIKFNLI